MNKKEIKKSTLIKLTSLSIATIIALFGGCFYFYNQSKNYKLALENNYKHSLQDFNDYLDNIYNDLDKSLYISSAYQLSNISAKLLSNSRAATMCLSTLPASELHLDNTFKFLSQVGDYASALNKKYHTNNKISTDDYQSLENLRSYAKKINNYVSELEYNVLKNNIDLDSPQMISAAKNNQNKNSENSLNFNNLEKNFDSYPKMIYDGPFSDHISSKTPEITKNLKEVSEDKAKKIAALALGMDQNLLTHNKDKNSNLPFYCFSGNNISIGVTKKGGLISYILNSRAVKNQNINPGEAIENAKKYISNTLKIPNIEQSYYEVNDNYCTINFAYLQNDTIIYPDLIKISVALDNGEIISVDTKGYINNHKERNIAKPSKSIEDAKNKISSYLTVIKEPRKAIIPTDGQNEVLTYEFICRSKNNETVLVYINCDTLEEEQILVLVESEKGVITA